MIKKYILSYKLVSNISIGWGKEKKNINHFFKIVVPQLLDYFKSNAKEIPELLILDVLKDNQTYATNIKDVIDLSKEISEKYDAKTSEIH